MSQPLQQSQTASDYIASQLRLEEVAREALPYQFDTCTKSLGPLRQSVFACLTCTPPPASSHQQFTPAGLCYSCSISCHGEHDLVELFTKRNFVCDCGTTRYSNSRTPCTLRLNATTGRKGGVVDEEPANTNKYDQNYAGKFCGCGEEYDPEKEKGTMFQCLGLGTVDDGGCGEDWWHAECLMGLPRTVDEKPVQAETISVAIKEESEQAGSAAMQQNPMSEAAYDAKQGDNTEQVDGHETHEAPLPKGFPSEDDFDHVICYKCVNTQPWLKQHAGQTGFLPALVHGPAILASSVGGHKRKAEDDEVVEAKRLKSDAADSVIQEESSATTQDEAPQTKIEGQTAIHESLPTPPAEELSLLVKEDFRNHFCRCSSCFPRLAKHPQLLEEEESYEPPLSDSEHDEHQSAAGRSVNSGSIYDRGEAALSSIDRVRAIEGVMAYNHVRDKVKEFLAPFAQSGKAVGAEDIKAYFAQLRGDELAKQEGS